MKDLPVQCPSCGILLDPNCIRYAIPLLDPVTQMTREEFSAEARTHTRAVLTVNGVGSFVKALLPVRLEDGRHITFGVWIGGLRRSEFLRIRDSWQTDKYRTLKFEEILANPIRPWGDRIFRAHRHIEAQGGASRPPLCIVSSRNVTLSQALTNAWPTAEMPSL